MLQKITQRSPRYIFLADDDEDDRSLFAEALAELDGSVILEEAENGKRLMDMIQTSQNLPPDLIFIDINMPIKSGLQCLEQIRKQDGAFKNLNVIVLSTCNNPETIRTALNLGATCYAIKPNSYSKLKQMIDCALKLNFSAPGLICNKDMMKS